MEMTPETTLLDRSAKRIDEHKRDETASML
jgi:hypothetical protein